MANRNQHRGGQHYQDINYQGSRNQMGQNGPAGQVNRGQQSAFQTNQGQYGGNYGHDTNYRGPLDYGNQGSPGNQGDFQGYADPSTRFGNEAYGGAQQEGAYGGAYGNYGLSRDAGYNPRETNANDSWEPESSRGSRGFGHSQNYGGALGYQDELQRGGPQNWQQFNDRFGRSGYQGGDHQGSSYQGSAQAYSGQGAHQHDPDYHQWRSEQIRGLDNDYKAWRDERYSKFSSEFGEWRKGRKDSQSSSRGSADADASSPTGNASQGHASAAPKSK